MLRKIRKSEGFSRRASFIFIDMASCYWCFAPVCHEGFLPINESKDGNGSNPSPL